MGREIKRVDLNFNWFEKTKDKDWEDKIWFGYLIKVAVPCELCDATGLINDETCHLCWRERYVNLELEPPKGNGWQMWETTSEDSPISPVFKTPEELAKWLVDNKASSFGDQTESYETWLKMILAGYAPTMAIENGKLISGVQMVADSNSLKEGD